jgi:Fe-S-cluster containining protein
MFPNHAKLKGLSAPARPVVTFFVTCAGRYSGLTVQISRNNSPNLDNRIMEDLLHNWEKKTWEHQKQYQYYLQKADKNKVLKQLPELHEEAFQRIDCLNCANCCKSYSPRFKGPDIKRISKYLNMKESDLIDTYLTMDNEGDYVARSLPCPFLGADNKCGIYDVRPSDCERFPYTDEDILLKRPRVTQKNSTFCPIVYFVLEKHLVAGR